jgi:arginine/ornithine antiporter
MPTFGLAVSSIVMQIFLIIVVTANDFYMAALSITGMMILPAYLFSGLYLWKTTLHPEQLGLERSRKNMRFRITGIAASAFCLWMIYAGGLTLLLLTSVFYFVGSVFFVMARREANTTIPVFTTAERFLFLFIVACSIASVVLLATGSVSI